VGLPKDWGTQKKTKHVAERQATRQVGQATGPRRSAEKMEMSKEEEKTQWSGGRVRKRRGFANQWESGRRRRQHPDRIILLTEGEQEELREKKDALSPAATRIVKNFGFGARQELLAWERL